MMGADEYQKPIQAVLDPMHLNEILKTDLINSGMAEPDLSRINTIRVSPLRETRLLV
jgi:hypothetical protein